MKDRFSPYTFHLASSPTVLNPSDQIFLLFQPSVEPLHSLVEGLLFRKLRLLVRKFGPNGETMYDAAVKIDLVWLADFFENVLGLTAFFRREDLIRF